jgi:hypothetical protein
MGHQVSKSAIPKLLEMLQYRRQVNRKTLERSIATAAAGPSRSRAPLTGCATMAVAVNTVAAITT